MIVEFGINLSNDAFIRSDYCFAALEDTRSKNFRI